MFGRFVSSVAGLVMAFLPANPVTAQYDVLIRNGRVLDGTGNPWRLADVAISDGRIARIGNLEAATATREIDASGQYVTPGFIDPHSHAGPGLTSNELSHARPLIAQGITTIFVNPDGGGDVDLQQQRLELMHDGLGTNVALLVPHGSVRREVLGMDDRAPTPTELEQMRSIVRRGMTHGAFGLSSGLYYAPGSYAETDEIIELARVAAEYGGIYTSHIRDEADYNIGVVAAVDEVIAIAREANTTGIVSHIKVLGPRVWGYSQALIHRIQRARDEGVQVFADQYPYQASGTSIGGALLPRWAQVGGGDSLMARLADPIQRGRIRSDILENLDRRGGAGRLQFQTHSADTSIEGRTMQEVADARGLHPADLAIDLTLAGGAGLVSFNMLESDIEALMAQQWTMTSSDGGLTSLGRGVPHPRYYGTFPRKIRLYVKERGAISLEHAVRSMTSLPASVMGLEDRGLLVAGAVADVVVFDLDELRDTATYDRPHSYALGMTHVLINGEAVLSNGEFTDALPGKVLNKRSTTPLIP
jgi:N-acyl-D-aspartate/D-glutamate deacylase